MKTAIVTGASSGIGLCITKKLIKIGYRVYGIARDFSKIDFQHNNFIKIICDITDVNNLEKTVKDIKSNEKEIYILINNAGVGHFAPHEQISTKNISKMVDTNLKAPLILTNMLLRDIKKSKGYIISISSITAKKSSTHGCAYAATKAGISHFSTSLFDETRKSGAKVITIHPDMTKTHFFDNLDFRHSDETDTYISPDTIANAIESILNQPEGTIITDITVRPQRNVIKRKNKL